MTYTPPNKQLNQSQYKQKQNAIRYCEKCRRDVIVSSYEDWLKHQANCDGPTEEMK